jgi:outer membrane protein assembly factor BamD
LSAYLRQFRASSLLPTTFSRPPGSVVLLIILLLFSGCSGKKQDITRDWPADRLYYAARSEMSDRRYEKAIDYYRKLESRYPYGRFAQQGMIDMAYAYWKHEEPELALATCDRFIREHPNHIDIDYVYYLKGRINFNEDQGIIGMVHKKDIADTDPVAAREAFDAFKILVTRYPKSKYAPDARERMTYLVDALARHDLKVAEYYFRRGAYVAAVNRAQDVVTTYPRTPAVEQALAIMVGGYKAMGLEELSEGAQRTLKANFPNSQISFEANKSKWWKFW